MAFNKLRANQIQLGILDNTHIANGANIDESKLNIDWDTRGDEILAKKLVIDYVQVSGKAVAGSVNNVSVTAEISASPATANNEKGAVVQNGKNKVILRDATTGDPVIGAYGNEVYGKLTHNGTDYIISFYEKDNGDVEQTYTFASATTIDFQFPQRFDFLEVSENFAANEKFVDGAADVSARLDLEQIAKDVFGISYTYDHDGSANRGKTLAQELIDETSGVTNTSVRAKDIIDEVVEARGGFAAVKNRFSNAENRLTTAEGNITGLQNEITAARGGEADLDTRLDNIDAAIATEVSDRTNAVQAVRDDLASNANGLGASLIGIEDSGAVFTATTVEGALAELETRLSNVEFTGGSEVTDARTSSLTGAHGSLDARLEAAESRFENVKTEVDAARGGEVDLNTRLTNIESDVATNASNHSSYVASNDARVTTVEGDITSHDSRITALEAVDHQHFAEDKQVNAGDPLIGTSQYTLQSGTFTPGNKSLTVYVNGMIQMEGVHYTEVVDGGSNGIAVSFAPELIAEGDVIQLRWWK